MEFMKDSRVYCVKGPMCNWELMGRDASGEGYVRKETGWLTSSEHIADTLQGVCSNYTHERPFLRHVHLIKGRAGAAKAYTPQLVAGMLKALRKQLQEEGRTSTMEAITSGSVPEEKVAGDGPWLRYWDDVNGGYLNPEKVQKARAEELTWVHDREVYEKATLQPAGGRQVAAHVPLT